MDIKSASDYGLITSMEECPLENFWVAILSNSVQVFQDIPSSAYSQPNPWVRLRQYCKDNDLSIAAMAYSNKQLDQSKQINLSHLADGYFYSRRVRKMFAPTNPAYLGFSDEAEGVGELFGSVLKIKWIHPNGMVEEEVRNVDLSIVDEDRSIILK